MTKIKFALFLWVLIDFSVFASVKVPEEVNDFKKNIVGTCKVVPLPPEPLKNLPNSTASCQIVTRLIANTSCERGVGSYSFWELQCSDSRYEGRVCSIFTYKNIRAKKALLHFYPVKMSDGLQAGSEVVEEEKELRSIKYDRDRDYALINRSLKACFP